MVFRKEQAIKKQSYQKMFSTTHSKTALKLKNKVMKKLLFGLIATVMFGFVGNAQTKITKEQARLKFATSMSEFVTQCAPSYKKGMTYDAFSLAILGGNSNSIIPTKEGQDLLKTAYTFVSKGTTTKEIIKSYPGVEMASVLYLVKDTKNAKDAGAIVFGTKIIGNSPLGDSFTSGRNCWICGALEWIWENHDEIISVLCMFISVC